MSNCNTAPWKKKCCPDVTVNECCLCEIDGCIVQACDAGDEQYVFSDTDVDVCINIKNDAVHEFSRCVVVVDPPSITFTETFCPPICDDPNDPDNQPNTPPEFCNCEFDATLLNAAGATVLGPIRIKPGQKKSLIAKGVSQLFITGVTSGDPNYNGVRGSYNGTARLVL